MGTKRRTHRIIRGLHTLAHSSAEPLGRNLDFNNLYYLHKLTLPLQLHSHFNSNQAVEGRQKSPSILGMADEERRKSLQFLVLYVCGVGSGSTTLPVTPLGGLLREVLSLAEAWEWRSSAWASTVWSFNTFRGFWQCTPQTLAKPITLLVHVHRH